MSIQINLPEGLSKQDFIELLGKYKVSVFQYDMDEIEEDIANA